MGVGLGILSFSSHPNPPGPYVKGWGNLWCVSLSLSLSPVCWVPIALPLMLLPGCDMQGAGAMAGHMCAPEKPSTPEEGALSLKPRGQGACGWSELCYVLPG